MTSCDPAPNAPSTCPGGYHCTEDGKCDAVCSASGGECGDGYRCTPDGRCVGADECVGLECKIAKCSAQGKPSTTITGTVYAPNGTLPLYGINVYVANTPLGPPVDGAVCDRCNDALPGYPLSLTKTDENGKFTLVDVPAGQNIPVVIQTGKWRRTITVPQVNECADTALAATETRLPKNSMEGYMPKIAISTGSADALECLIRKLGIDDSEIATDGGPGKIHLFADTDAGGGEGANQFASSFPGGSGKFANSKMLWNDLGSLKRYDIVILSCEGGQHPETKPQAAMDALKGYADLGGRVFLSHWHNVWLSGAGVIQSSGNGQKPAVWSGPNGVATWNNNGQDFSGNDVIDEMNNPKGMSFANWMLNVMGSTQRDLVLIGKDPSGQGTGRQTCTSVATPKVERWVYWPLNGVQYPQMFQFTTPYEADPGNRCGKVVFSDMHVSGDSKSVSTTPFPNSCATNPLTPQEKALAFMFFDIASCVQPPIL